MSLRSSRRRSGCPSVPVVLAWGQAEEALALAAHRHRWGLRPHVAALYRALRDHSDVPVARAELAICVLEELGLVEDGALVADTPRTDLRRSTTFGEAERLLAEGLAALGAAVPHRSSRRAESAVPLRRGHGGDPPNERPYDRRPRRAQDRSFAGAAWPSTPTARAPPVQHADLDRARAPAAGRPLRDRRGARGGRRGADRPRARRGGVPLRVRAPRRPAPQVRRGLHRPPGRRREDLRRHAARHRDARRGAAARHRRGHVGVAGGGRPRSSARRSRASSTASRSSPASRSSRATSSRPRTTAR